MPTLALYLQENIVLGSQDGQADWKAFITQSPNNLSHYTFLGTRRDAEHASLPDVLLTFRSKQALMTFLVEAFFCSTSTLTFSLLLMDANPERNFVDYEAASHDATELFAFDNAEFDESRVSRVVDLLSFTAVPV